MVDDPVAIRKYRITASDGERHDALHHNLDAANMLNEQECDRGGTDAEFATVQNEDLRRIER